MILNAADRLEEWIGRVREHAFNVLNQGGEVQGWKLVAKRSTRKWADEATVTKKAKKCFGDKAFTTPELLSPAQMEKQIKISKQFVADNTVSTSSGSTLVRADDPRPAFTLIQSEFEIIEEHVALEKPLVKSKMGKK